MRADEFVPLQLAEESVPRERAGPRGRPALDRKPQRPPQKRARHLLEEEAAAGREEAADLRHSCRPSRIWWIAPKSKIASNDRSGAAIRLPSPIDTRTPARSESPRRARSTMSGSMSMASNSAARKRSTMISAPTPRPQPTSSAVPPSTRPPSRSRSGATAWRWTKARVGLFRASLPRRVSFITRGPLPAQACA
jgi:hypothetical protein